MSDLSNSNRSELASANTAIAPNGLKDGESPNKLAGILREHFAAEKRFYNQINAIYTSTGSANAYVLTFTQAPEALRAGMKFAFIPNFTSTGAATLNINGLGAKAIVASDGSALAANAIVANNSVVVVYNGTSFLLETGSNSPVFSGTVTAGAITGSGAGLTALNASNISTGTIADARLPSSMAGKSFTSTVTITGSELINTNGSTLSIQRNNANAIDIEAFQTSNNTVKHSIDLNKYGGAVTIGGNTVWHAGNDGVGSGLDADTLDGQSGAFYQNATNLNAGTIADARLPATMSGKNFTGNIGFPSGFGTNQIIAGTADGASYTNFNFAIQGWYGMGMKDANNLVNGYYDFRVGKWDTKGGFYKNGVEMWHAGNDGAGSGLDADKLDGADSSYFKDRANHTGTQAIGTIANLQATLDAKLNKGGDMMTGSLEIKAGDPTLWLHLPNVKRGRWVIDTYGSLLWQDQGGQTHFYITSSGQIWTQQLGDLNTRIEDRANAWGAAHFYNAVTGSRMAGETAWNRSGTTGKWQNSGYVLTGVQGTSPGGDATYFARQPQLYIPNVGWYAAFAF
ncbi:hypothetical protein [Rhizobium sp.]|uniref:hypothetical protein n=1 Tax=Rhizobium sp. TaxID=391 RepID=UPI0034C66C26